MDYRNLLGELFDTVVSPDRNGGFGRLLFAAEEPGAGKGSSGVDPGNAVGPRVGGRRGGKARKVSRKVSSGDAASPEEVEKIENKERAVIPRREVGLDRRSQRRAFNLIVAAGVGAFAAANGLSLDAARFVLNRAGRASMPMDAIPLWIRQLPSKEGDGVANLAAVAPVEFVAANQVVEKTPVVGKGLVVSCVAPVEVAAPVSPVADWRPNAETLPVLSATARVDSVVKLGDCVVCVLAGVRGNPRYVVSGSGRRVVVFRGGVPNSVAPGYWIEGRKVLRRNFRPIERSV